MNKNTKNKIVLYENKNGKAELHADIEKDTLWATQEQISKLFQADRSVVTKNINNIFKDKELNRNSVCAKFAHTAPDGKKYITSFYNLDVILSVGYRTNSVSKDLI
jgi:hypothetical protein